MKERRSNNERNAIRYLMSQDETKYTQAMRKFDAMSEMDKRLIITLARKKKEETRNNA